MSIKVECQYCGKILTSDYQSVLDNNLPTHEANCKKNPNLLNLKYETPKGNKLFKATCIKCGKKFEYYYYNELINNLFWHEKYCKGHRGVNP